MSDNRMKYTIDSNMQFPLVEIALEAGESAYIQQGSMVYHTPSVTLNTKLNARGGSGFGKLMGPSVGQWYQANLCLSRKPFPIVTMEKLPLRLQHQVRLLPWNLGQSNID